CAREGVGLRRMDYW
nr:immunoglobulin heavy chain junction region [Mus musculus]